MVYVPVFGILPLRGSVYRCVQEGRYWYHNRLGRRLINPYEPWY
jgi:hypothetical protein